MGIDLDLALARTAVRAKRKRVHSLQAKMWFVQKHVGSFIMSASMGVARPLIHVEHRHRRVHSNPKPSGVCQSKTAVFALRRIGRARNTLRSTQ